MTSAFGTLFFPTVYFSCSFTSRLEGFFQELESVFKESEVSSKEAEALLLRAQGL